MCNIRLLTPNDIEVRAQQVSEKGIILLLYKNARVDMAILDECFGIFGWQREHSFKDGKNYCRVSIYNKETQEWVSKEDIGTESNTEAQKGEASDAFKRACVNIGIGRELYTAPFIWIAANQGDVTKDERTNRCRLSSNVHFRVSAIDYNDDRSIKSLQITDSNGTTRFTYPRSSTASKQAAAPVAKAQPEASEPKKRITHEDLAPETVKDGKHICDALLQWIYNRFVLANYPADFDVKAHLLNSYDADEDVVKRFIELFNSYKQARNGK